MIHNDGNIYIGGWKQNKGDGYGEYYSKNGVVYKGEWLNDIQHGKGVEIYAEGEEYNG